VIPDPRGFDERYAEAVRFLYDEAEALDDGRLADWLELLTDDIDYRIPTRITRERATKRSPFSDASFFMIEDRGSLTTRVRRFDTAFAFSEDPPTRTRRIIGNVRTAPGPRADELAVKSNFILFRTKDDQPSQLLAGERHDVLRWIGPAPRLARRLVLLEHTVLPMENLAIFL
jgi:3-phenylpropionate/cinnamic acid dioxygenase small subunit